ncbi:MAG: aspartate/tyrosine/aromatic aminotransferase [Proteobacteria bacterium]|nr:aspartate/tyrosine/aromatic aminotransferase [Pseudomonadota bacterium]
MNAPLANSGTFLAAIEMAPRDPILGVTEAFNADPRAEKVNLGVGVYTDDAGKIPLLGCVKRAEDDIAAHASARGYLPIDGMPAYDKATQALLFGADSPVVTSGRAITVQALGGTGGLRVGADFLKRFAPNAQVWISDPSWENHRALFEGAGFTVKNYRYYDAATRGLDFDGMVAALQGMPAGDVVVLHACCHNPTGVDPAPAQWETILEVVRSRKLVPFLDLAYQGFAEGLEPDGAVVRAFAATPGPLVISSSYSKSFSLYGERVGAFTLVAADKDEAARALSQVKRIARILWSNPPTHGAKVVAAVLGTPELRAQWEAELGGMRNRIREMRVLLHAKLVELAPANDWDFVTAQRGMFSYTGLTKDQVARMRSEFGVYAVDSGRICVAALNTRNVAYVAGAIAAVSK